MIEKSDLNSEDGSLGLQGGHRVRAADRQGFLRRGVQGPLPWKQDQAAKKGKKKFRVLRGGEAGVKGLACVVEQRYHSRDEDCENKIKILCVVRHHKRQRVRKVAQDDGDLRVLVREEAGQRRGKEQDSKDHEDNRKDTHLFVALKVNSKGI